MTGLIKDSDSYNQKLSDLTGYNLIDINVMAVPDNFLSIIDENYYFPNTFQPGLQYNKTGGQINAVNMVYSDEGLNPYNSNLTDYYNITTCSPSASLEGK